MKFLYYWHLLFDDLPIHFKEYRRIARKTTQLRETKKNCLMSEYYISNVFNGTLICHKWAKKLSFKYL